MTELGGLAGVLPRSDESQVSGGLAQMLAKVHAQVLGVEDLCRLIG